MAEHAPAALTGEANQAIPAVRMARLIGLELPKACLPGVLQGLEAIEMHLGVLRAAEEEQAG